MKNFKLLLGATTILAATGLIAYASTPVVSNGVTTSAKFNASVEIERPVGLTATDVDFGKIMVRPTATSDIKVEMNLAGTGYVTVISGDAYIPSGTEGSFGRVCYEAHPSNYVSVALINDNKTYNLEGPGAAKITYKPEISTATHGGGASLSGKCANIGGTLTIPANAEVGKYEGSVTVDMIFTGHDVDPLNND